MSDNTEHSRTTLWGIHLLAIVLISTVSIVVFAKNLFIDNAVVFQDESVYKASADPQIDQTLVVERGLAPVLPNRLFLAIYGFGSHFGSNYYAFAQLLNVLFWALGLLVLYRLAALSGLSEVRSFAFLAVSALLPLSAYTKYFMPESLFFALFCTSVYALMFGLQRKRDAPIIIAGALVGLLYFVKPHAIAVMAASAGFLLLLPGQLRLNALFGSGLLVVMGLGRWVAPKPASGSSLGSYRSVLDEVVGKLAGPGDAMAEVVLKVSAGHALFWLCGFGLSLLVVVSVLVPRLRLRQRGVEAPKGLWLLSLYLLIEGIALVGMAVMFSSLIGEVGRVHSRYYFFLYPLALLVLFHFDQLQLTLGGRIVGVVLAVAGPVLILVFAEGYSSVLYMSVVGDAPELGFVFFSKPLRVTLMVAAAIAGTWTVLQPRRLALRLAVFAVTSVISSVYVAMSQKSLFRGPLTTGREAVAVEEFLGREKMIDAVVVGDQRDTMTKFLFNLSTTPFLQELPLGANLDQIATMFPKSTQVIALSESYVLSAPLFQCTPLGQIRICTITR